VSLPDIIPDINGFRICYKTALRSLMVFQQTVLFFFTVSSNQLDIIINQLHFNRDSGLYHSRCGSPGIKKRYYNNLQKIIAIFSAIYEKKHFMRWMVIRKMSCLKKRKKLLAPVPAALTTARSTKRIGNNYHFHLVYGWIGLGFPAASVVTGSSGRAFRTAGTAVVGIPGLLAPIGHGVVAVKRWRPADLTAGAIVADAEIGCTTSTGIPAGAAVLGIVNVDLPLAAGLVNICLSTAPPRAVIKIGLAPVTIYIGSPLPRAVPVAGLAGFDRAFCIGASEFCNILPIKIQARVPAGSTVAGIRGNVNTGFPAQALWGGTGSCGHGYGTQIGPYRTNRFYRRVLDKCWNRGYRPLDNRHLARGRADEIRAEPELCNEYHRKHNNCHCNDDMHCAYLRKAGLLFLF
jgi:hypothetical protein